MPESRRYYQVMLAISVLSGVASAAVLYYAIAYDSIGLALGCAYPLACLSAAIFLIDRPTEKLWPHSE